MQAKDQYKATEILSDNWKKKKRQKQNKKWKNNYFRMTKFC